LLQALAQGLVAGVVLGDGERLGGGLEVGREEGGGVTVASGIDPDADAVESGGGRHGSHPRGQEGGKWDECSRGGRESPPRTLGQGILVMSGRAARCTKTSAQAGGSNLREEVKASGRVQLSPRHRGQYRKLAGIDHTRARNRVGPARVGNR